MDFLMIGGTRYMGRIAVERLLERGDRVTVFSRGKTIPHWWDRVEHIIGDRTDVAGFSAKLKGKKLDAVIDTYAMTKQDVESAVATFDGNVGRYLFISTGSVYFEGYLDFYTHCPFKESDVDWSGLDYSYPEGETPYGVGKRHCEKWLQENSTVPYTIIRVPAVMGWDDPSFRMWWWVQRALDGGPVVVPAEEHSVFCTLYAEDAADAWLQAIASPAAANQTYHIAMKGDYDCRTLGRARVGGSRPGKLGHFRSSRRDRQRRVPERRLRAPFVEALPIYSRPGKSGA